MKLINNNISPLPFYDDIELQNHRKDYAFGQIYPLVIHKNVIMPFQVVLPETARENISVFLHCVNDSRLSGNISQQMKEAGLKLHKYSNFSVLIYPGIFPINMIKYEGQYYLNIVIAGAGQIYSDIFNSVNRIDDYLLIEYYNDYNFELKNGIVDFSDNFKFKCYIKTQIGKPEYSFEEEATERMGYTFIESQVSKKIYKFVFLAPEYLCDALRIVRLCNNKRILCKNQQYDLTSFSMNPKWEEQGDLASVECEFETDTVISNLGGYTAELIGGDFNNDFNNDFNKE